MNKNERIKLLEEENKRLRLSMINFICRSGELTISEIRLYMDKFIHVLKRMTRPELRNPPPPPPPARTIYEPSFIVMKWKHIKKLILNK